MNIEYKVKCNCGYDPIITDATINHVKGEMTLYIHDHDCKSPFEDLFKKGEKVKIVVEQCKCPGGDHEARRRSIDIPIIENSMTLKAVKVIHCPTCKTNYLREDFLDQLESRFVRAGIPTNKTFLWGMIRKGLDYWEEKFGTEYVAKREGEHDGKAGETGTAGK